mgnify:CR=1 FL=1
MVNTYFEFKLNLFPVKVKRKFRNALSLWNNKNQL